MTDTELIAKQAKDVEELKVQVADYSACMRKIYNILYSIGGPLNDNRLGYTGAQLMTFRDIAHQVMFEDED